MKQGTKLLELDNGYHLFTRKEGKGPVKMLCVHGGPGGNHEEFENFAQNLNDKGVEVYSLARVKALTDDGHVVFN